MSLDLVIIAILLAAGSGCPGLCLPRGSAWGQRLAAGLLGGAALSGLTGAGLAWRDGLTAVATLPWPAVGHGTLGVDPLSAFFLVPIFLMGFLGSVYGLGYWPARRHPGNARRLHLFWGWLVAGMGVLVASRQALAFLLGWEVMALSAFFLVATEDHRAPCRQAGWLYLVATHIGTLALFGMIALWRRSTGAYGMEVAGMGALSLGTKNALFGLALLGFGLKAGMMPLHFWLPGAHANAPTQVSAMLSGVVLKMGVYGLVRWLSLIPRPPLAWGALILGLGAASALLGVVFAIAQHDLKRLLAYHSIENIGIILLGLGLAMLGRSAGRADWVVLGLAGCLLHVWNHALFKSLLFLAAGSVIHATGTRQIDRLGGLGRTMPWTAGLFVVGAVAICGLPPLNGLVSEWLLYLGLLRTAVPGGAGWAAAAVVAAPVLAMVGALAVACFVKVLGAVFLGLPRTGKAGHEAPLSMRLPMVALAGGCVLIGLAPSLFGAVVERAMVGWMPEMAVPLPCLATLVPLDALGRLALGLTAGLAVIAFGLGRRVRGVPRVVTWDCGYARPTSRMQYSASSFAQTLVKLFGWVLRPHERRPRLAGLFPSPTSLHSQVDDAVLDRFLLPLGRDLERRCGWFRRFQQGVTQHYVLYILVAVVLLLGTLIPVEEILARWFAP